MGTIEATPKPAIINPKIDIKANLLIKIIKEPNSDKIIDIKRKL